MGSTHTNTYFNGEKFVDIDDEIRQESLENSIELVNKVCPCCKRIGCWIVDEEDKNFIVCKCGESAEFK